MLFNSYIFLFIFLPVSTAVFWLLTYRRDYRYSVLWLCVCSFTFYWYGEGDHILLVLISIATNYGFGRLIGATEGSPRRNLLIAGLVFNLSLLIYFKYFNFFVNSLSSVGVWHPFTPDVVLPLGISFYTFTQIAYLADVSTGKGAEREFPSYFLFVTFFPHLIAGPILHHKEMMPQFRSPRRRYISLYLYSGLAMFAIGLAKKTFLADPIGQVASGVFGTDDPGFFVSWVGVVAYTLQIYFDFSAYSDMALGISQMLGIKLPINFNSPYKAVSLIDFWRRWHITLSRFLRDYLYFGLGGNRLGHRRRYLNLFLTMLLGGFWHGADWTFLLWGALHGAGLMAVHGYTSFRIRLSLPSMPVAAAWLLTILFVMTAWVPFRADGLRGTLNIWKGMAGLNGFALPELGPLRAISSRLSLPLEAVSFDVSSLAVIAGAIMIVVYAPNSQQITRRFRLGLDSPGYNAFGPHTSYTLGVGWPSAVLIAAMLGLSVRQIGGYSEFIYFRF